MEKIYSIILIVITLGMFSCTDSGMYDYGNIYMKAKQYGDSVRIARQDSVELRQTFINELFTNYPKDIVETEEEYSVQFVDQSYYALYKDNMFQVVTTPSWKVMSQLDEAMNTDGVKHEIHKYGKNYWITWKANYFMPTVY